MRARARLLPFFALLTASACGGVSTSSDVSSGQAMIEMSDAINDLRLENANLQAQIDSLRGEVARQDTLVRRMAAVAGMPMPTP